MNQQNDYQYIQVPMNLFYLMDANCSKVLTTLVQMNSYYPKEDGYFECAYKTLELACGLSQNLIKASLAGLFLERIIDVVSVGKGRGKHTNRYKVNVEKFKDYEKTPVGIAIMTEDKPIHQADYKGTRFKLPWDIYKSDYEVAQETAQSIAQGTAQKVTTNINNIENIPNIKNIDNIKEYNIINKEEDMLVNVIEDKDTFYDDNERNLIMITEEEKKPCTKEHLKTIYLNSFGELMSNYPGINYSLLLVKQTDSFYDCYRDIVNELVMKIHQQSQRNVTTGEVLEMLNRYLDYIKYPCQ